MFGIMPVPSLDRRVLRDKDVVYGDRDAPRANAGTPSIKKVVASELVNERCELSMKTKSARLHPVEQAQLVDSIGA